ncbi:hypothetical protein MAL01_10130 [Leptospira noguchii]|uniref:hypothetical protein n=1 Tax=Leptospira noguchii TaxID=28182 RepID=UPI001FB695DE|nr:hypothetical protein [Leptospira noguchii]UOG33016.1 hypothetical protein MAL02_09875 [Leptospira noguchii]UOG33026.1 hypothetical protein MAL02_09940 [Leptospira noguchii]UOG43826.1 hypothetical protein MAL01_10065 [Leptospira noguchii]UOG43836.1 hypothetical protein MAL01_10130 [Leptospira noguchii]
MKSEIQSISYLRLVCREEKENLLDERLEIYWNRFERMSSQEKRKEVKQLFTSLYKTEQKKEATLNDLIEHRHREAELKRTLRMIGERMRG